MFAHLAQHPARFFGIVLVIPLSFVLTLLAVLDLPLAQAHPHVATPSLAAHASSAIPIAQPAGTEPAAPSNGVNVDISNFAFSPSVITITAGTVVTWTNLDAAPHTTTSDIGSTDPWDSGTLGQGGTFTRTFNAPGVYGYHCAIHPAMQGTLVVLAAESPQAPLGLSVKGPSGGVAEVANTFSATVSPITTTQPITYLWEATGQLPVTHTQQALSDTLAFTWPAAQVGPQLITVTAANSAGSVSANYVITIVSPAGAGVTDVSIVDFAFQPRAITITVGSSVRWINTGQQLHTSTSAVGSPDSWDSGNLNPGEVFTRTFSMPGVHAYLCTPHPGMTGTVTVLTQVYLPLILR